MGHTLLLTMEYDWMGVGHVYETFKWLCRHRFAVHRCTGIDVNASFHRHHCAGIVVNVHCKLHIVHLQQCTVYTVQVYTVQYNGTTAAVHTCMGVLPCIITQRSQAEADHTIPSHTTPHHTKQRETPSRSSWLRKKTACCWF